MTDIAFSIDDILPTLKGIPGEKLARMLLDVNLVQVKAMEKAIRIQKKLGNKKLISAILIETGIISEDEQRRLIRKNGRALRIGDLVCELGYITLAQLSEAETAMSKHPGKRIGEILKILGLINERQLAQALSEQLSIPLLHIEMDMINSELVRKISFKFARSHLLIPFAASETQVSIITADPLDKSGLNTVAQQLGKTPVLSIGVPSIITTLLDKLEAGTKAGNVEPKNQVADVVDSLLLSALRDHASDIHLEPLEDRMRVRFRMDGVLIHKMDIPKGLAERISARIKVLASMDISDTRCHQDGRITRTVDQISSDFRVSTYVTVFGENMVLRILRTDGGIRGLEQSNMSPALLERFKFEALDTPTGVIIVTGPTGSGKTTTMYAGIDYLNRPTTKIITIEDPVEFVIDGIMQCSVDNKAGRTFEKSLMSVVRQDPDIIVLGEVRDAYSAGVAIEAALTGHKVITTFHTEDSIGALLRLMEMKIEPFLIASTVVAVLAQRLIRTICPDCRQAYMPDQRIAVSVGVDESTLNNHTFYRGMGCDTCHGTGYHGRTPLHELLVINDAVRAAVQEQKPPHEIREISCASTGLLSLMENGMCKAMKSETTLEEVYRIAPRTASKRSVKEVLTMMGEEGL